MSTRNFRKHTRLCFGIRACPCCRQAFPCRNRWCDYKFPDPIRIPTELQPYFVWKNTRDDITPEAMALELRALRWLVSLRKKVWSRFRFS